MPRRLIRVAGAAAGLVLACGGTTRQSVDQASAGADAGGVTNSSSGASPVASAGAGAAAFAGVGNAAASPGGATAGVPLPVDAPVPMCFEPDQLPADWYVDHAGGASARECPVAATGTFGIGYCYFEVSDVVPTSSPPGREAECCYWLRTFHCR